MKDTTMYLILNPSLVRWIDANKGELSRPAFIVKVLRDLMQDTTPTMGDIHTKGKNEENISYGVNHTPEQN
jgi:hypothetical protein